MFFYIYYRYGGVGLSGEKKGAVHIAEDVIISIASAAVNEVRGVEKIRSDYGFFQEKNPVRVRVTGDVIEIFADVVLKNGVSAVRACEKIQNAVKSEVQSVTGITVSKVNVNVSGISFEKK